MLLIHRRYASRKKRGVISARTPAIGHVISSTSVTAPQSPPLSAPTEWQIKPQHDVLLQLQCDGLHPPQCCAPLARPLQPLPVPPPELSTTGSLIAPMRIIESSLICIDDGNCALSIFYSAMGCRTSSFLLLGLCDMGRGHIQD